MRTAPQAVKDYCAANNITWRADLFTFTLADGSVYRWTTCDASLLVSGQTYVADGSVLSRSTLRQSAKLEIDTMTIKLGGTVLLSGVKVAARAVQGFFDGARVRLDHMLGNPSLPPILSLFEGRVADVQPEATVVSVVVKSDLEALNQLVPRFVYQAQCGNTLYDATCGVTKAPTTTTVSASPTPTTSSFARATVVASALGFVEFVTGANAGLRRSILTDASGVLTVTPALPVAPAAGDQIRTYRGCDRTRSATTGCASFGNQVNFRGQIHIPKPPAKGP